MSPVIDLRGLWIGVVAGAFGGLAGLGGGVIMVPLMIAWAKLGQHRAHATSLVAVVATGIFGAWSYATGGAVAYRTALVVAVASTLGAAWSSSLAPRVSALRLRRGFHVVQLLIALSLPFADLVPGVGAAEGWFALPVALLIGLTGGVLAGLLGIGGGAVVVPLLVFLFGFEQQIAQGTSLAVMIPAGIAGSIVHGRAGTIDRRLAIPLTLGVAAGAYFGGQIALLLPGLVLRLFFSALLAYMGWRGLRAPAPPVKPSSVSPRP